MKILNFLVIIPVLGIFLICASCSTMYSISGNGDLITSEKTVSPFNQIHNNGNADVYFHAAQEYRAVVTIDSNLVEYVELVSGNNELSIGMKSGRSYSYTKFVVDIYCPVLNGVEISGFGYFSSDDTIAVPSFEAKISGSGKIEGKIESAYFSVNISGSGKIIVSGNCDNSNINISGSGKFSGSDLHINNAVVHISGSGDVNIYVTDTLQANISGSGNIKYRGNPVINSDISGSGKIQKI